MTYPPKTPTEAWANVVAGIQRELRDLLAAIDRDATPITSLRTGQPDHVDATQQIIKRVHRTLNNLPLDVLITNAVAADHPTMGKTPGQLLDTAASAVAGAMQAEDHQAPEHVDQVSAEAYADAALRAVGVIR
jgi:hypothetical protein